MMKSGRLGWSWVAVAVLACGRTSPLDGWDDAPLVEVGGGGNGGAGGSSGSRPVAFGGTATSGGGNGGTFGIAGMSSTGGTAIGAAGAAGTTAVGGAPDSCSLAFGDCASAAEPECSDHPTCEGALLEQMSPTADYVNLVELVSLPDGHLAGTGTFRGTVDFGGSSTPLHSDEAAAQDDLGDAFVVMYDASGVAQWATSFGGAGAQRATGIAATPDNDLIIQGSWTDPNDATAPRAFLARFRRDGSLLWSLPFGNEAASVFPSQVRIDNDGVLWAAGSFEGELRIGDSSLSATQLSGYLMSYVPKQLPRLQLIVPDGWLANGVSNLVVDDEDNVAVVGMGDDAVGRKKTFFRKLSAKTGLVFEKQFQSASLFLVTSLAVDRKMRLTLSGTFDRGFTNEGQTFTPDPADTDLWLAQYSREGELNWQKQIRGNGQPSLVYASVADRFDNLVFGGYSRSLRFDGEPAPGAERGWSFFFKLRPDGTKLWARITDDLGWPVTMATNSAGEIWVGSRAALLSRLSP